MNVDAERPPPSGDPAETSRKEIYSYNTPWVNYSLGWCNRPENPFRFAVGSYVEEYANRIEIVQLNDENERLEQVGSFDHHYPATKIMWQPNPSTENAVLATTGDYVRLWEVKEKAESKTSQTKVSLKTTLNNNHKTEFCAPLTSFDWNTDSPNLIGVSSIDTTCSIWDIEASRTIAHLYAHDKEVYDIAFGHGKDQFASVGADGSVRAFDLRKLDTSTILYEFPKLSPILKVSWNKQDPNYIAAIGANASTITILDTRNSTKPLCVLSNHQRPCNAIQWAPHSSWHICSGSDDQHALIWDLTAMPKPVEDPILAYQAEGEVNNLSWSALQTDWIVIGFNKTVQILRV